MAIVSVCVCVCELVYKLKGIEAAQNVNGFSFQGFCRSAYEEQFCLFTVSLSFNVSLNDLQETLSLSVP
ncbi:hypothetical protein L6452_22302 [Arctium lappa]|uniref:Uncharacterized protein n=1 Tax=Arctium lappa TaxID=4217 RepID=A0ACB9B136_ARCLA|nr:hypothetical protein L6452_22302 [Arctium lappa]